MNKTILQGRLVKDPEVKYTATGSAITRITVATDRWNSKEQKNEADFHPCVAFGRNAELIADRFVKGSKILIEGSHKSGSYTNNDGKTEYTYNVWIEKFEFCESNATGKTSSNEKPKADDFLPDFGDMEELPFN